MSIEGSLQLLNIETLDGLTTESLKRAFKVGAVQSHPDKGGKEGDFDKLLSAYLHLSSVLKRLTGGRDGLQAVLAVDEVEKARQAQFESEMNNMINDVFDSMHLAEHDEWREKFNEAFEKHHVPHNNVKGYDDWFKKHNDDKNDEAAESATHSMPLDQWNQQFEKIIRGGKPPVTNYSKMMVFQEHMAYDNQYQNIGSALIERKDTTFTSYGWDRPAYTDLHDAYTTETTLLDKLPDYEPVHQSLDELIEERAKVFDVKGDKELEALHAYEKRVLDKAAQESKENEERLTEYFKSASVSQWALRGTNADKTDGTI